VSHTLGANILEAIKQHMTTTDFLLLMLALFSLLIAGFEWQALNRAAAAEASAEAAQSDRQQQTDTDTDAAANADENTRAPWTDENTRAPGVGGHRQQKNENSH